MPARAQVQSSKFKVQGSRLPSSVHEARKAKAVAPLLLDWFLHNARDLPWRRTLDPYAIWISEIMLQQTQVKTVIPFYERWLRELPTVKHLARAKTDRVLKLWEGLGYYTRARNLQKAARQIVEPHASEFPRAFDAILALPGIGRYTSGAICSIAFDQPTAILDGNVIRVLTRLFGIRQNPREKATNEILWQLAEQLVRAASAGSTFRVRHPAFLLSGPCSALNQSLMELGATVCLPRQPRCDACPLARRCVARRDSLTDLLPNVGPRITPTRRRFVAVVVERAGRVLVCQRPPDGLNGSLWEFPNGEAKHGDAAQLATDLIGTQNESKPAPLCRITHSITRYRLELEAFTAQLNGAPVGATADARWIPLGRLDHLAFTSAHRKVLTHFLAQRVNA